MVEKRRGQGQDLELEVIGRLVLAFGHVHIDELEVDVLLKEAGQDSRDGRRYGRAVHRHASHAFVAPSPSSCKYLAICRQNETEESNRDVTDRRWLDSHTVFIVI